MRFVTALAFSEPADFLAIARAADACGWDALAVSDHVVLPAEVHSPYPYAPDGKVHWDGATPWPDPWVSIGAMAAVTTRLQFLTNVYVLPARNPFAVAKAVGTAAVLSGNRVILGIGVGWMREEFALLEQDFATRGRRADEAITVLRTLWRGGMVSHHGEFYDFGPVAMSPAPTRPVPVYVGGVSPAALRRAARFGDGWISVLHTTAEIRDFVTRLRALRQEYGRDGVPFEICVSCSDAFDLDGYRRLDDAGVGAVLTVPWLLYGGDPTRLETKRDGLRRFADTVIAPWR